MPQLIRVSGFGVCAAAAVAVFVLLAPKVPTSTPTLPNATQYQSLIEQALADGTANNATAQGAPQQAVVNGWTARDLLTIIAKEDQDILTAQGAVVDATGTLQTTPFDERIPGLLVIAIFAVSWAGISAPRPIAAVAERPIAPAQPWTPA
jgi:hypothetical protein